MDKKKNIYIDKNYILPTDRPDFFGGYLTGNKQFFFYASFRTCGMSRYTPIYDKMSSIYDKNWGRISFLNSWWTNDWRKKNWRCPAKLKLKLTKYLEIDSGSKATVRIHLKLSKHLISMILFFWKSLMSLHLSFLYVTYISESIVLRSKSSATTRWTGKGYHTHRKQLRLHPCANAT